MALYNSVRMRKLKMSDLKGLAGHNQRTYREKGSRIDYTKTHLNETLHGNSTGLREDVLKRLDETGVKINKGEHNSSTVAVEVVLTVSPEYFRENALDWGEFDREKTDKWKEKVMQTMRDEYGENLINGELHLDEATPHLHLTLTPIVEKTRKKRRTKAQIAAGEAAETYTTNVLDAKNMFNRKALERLQTITAKPLEELGIKRGIKGSQKTHQTTKSYWKKVESYIDNQVKKLMPVITVKEKPLMTSAKAHADDEQKRIKKQVKSFILKLYKDLEGKMSEASFWKDKYETERNRTALVRKSLEPDEEIENFVRKYQLRDNAKKVEIQELKEELQRKDEKISSLESENHIKDMQLSEASQTISEMEGKVTQAQHAQRRLEIDLERSRDNNEGLHR